MMLQAQHHSKIVAEYDEKDKKINVVQELTFFNQTNDTLQSIMLNDWMNAYGDKNSDIGKRFADEFERAFHLAKEKDRGRTENITIITTENSFLTWKRDENSADVIEIQLKEKLSPGEKIKLHLTYSVKIPNARFTKFGFTDDEKVYLKNWFLTPSRYENGSFVKYNNHNIDDIANAVSDYDLEIRLPKNLEVFTDLNKVSETVFTGKNRLDFNLFFGKKNEFESFINQKLEVVTDFRDNRVDDIQRAIVIDKIVNWVDENLGKYPHQKLILAKADYERSPFYGLNQLPAFIAPFPDQFLYEIKFLKTFLNNYVHSTLNLNPRDDNWIYDGFQIYLMMKYIDEFYPKITMMGNVAKLKIMRGYNLVSLDFNGQYSYFYMLMARKNLDQSLGSAKTDLIKFNEQIASKYRAGLSIRFLDNYLQKGIVKNSIRQFYNLNKVQQTTDKDFETILKSNTTKNIDWFFSTIVHSRELIDYKFAKVSKTQDSITFSIKNKTDLPIPIPIYGLKKKEIVFKDWLDLKECDSTFTIPRKQADKIILNYNNEVPEYNLRNNWKKLEGFFPNNRPVKCVFMKDLEDSYYNQILYVPTLTYNLYDGLSPGLRLHNKTILDKPFIFDLAPSYSTKSKNLSGGGGFIINDNRRTGSLYSIRYLLSGSYFHYAPDASYTKITPAVEFRFRKPDFRDNTKEGILLRQVIVTRDQSKIVPTDLEANYSVFNARYFNSKTEITKHSSTNADIQFGSNFGKIATEWEYRKLFENNRQVNLRLYLGAFLYNNTNSDYFSFALDRPTDYLFDYNFYGRSESSGFFSQQYIQAEGGFKSKLNTAYANQWMGTVNGSFNIWRWIEIYSDFGLIKNKNQSAQFVYDNGIRLNLVTDYFELYLPVYSNNGLEINQKNYNEKIRFVITFSPKTLVNLFNRKWF